MNPAANPEGEPRAAQAAPLWPLSVEEVNVTLGGAEVLRQLNFSIGPGAPTVLLGANGAGKTLTLKLCHGMLRPSAGRVRWGGRDCTPPVARQALVLHRPVLLRRSVLANVRFVLASQGIARAQRAARAQEALNLLGLEALAALPATRLSAGQQQRLNLARIWALRPEVLFLDEPCTNLDPEAALALERAIFAIGATGTKVVFSTHNLAQARRLAGEVLFLERGRLVETGPAESFFTNPRAPEARAFLREG